MNPYALQSPFAHLDLFSGIGGFALAAMREGFRTVAFAEIDPYASAVLKKHWPDVPNLGDVRTFPAIRGCTVLTGGPPCQSLSVAGRRNGTSDHRYLWPPMFDAIRRCEPDWIIVENVVNAANMVLAAWQDDLAEAGYESQAFDIPNCAVGLPSVERHLWLVAARSGKRLEGLQKTSLSRRAEGKPCVGQIYGGIADSRNGPHLPMPGLLRTRKGFPGYVDRIRGLGNAVPPPAAQTFFRAIRLIESHP